jgi:integrase/recombinase XerC
VLTKLTDRDTHDRGARSLAKLTQTAGPQRDVEFFLLACRSEGRTQPTIKDYRQKLGVLVRFLEGQGIHSVFDITSADIRFYMLDLESRMKLISVGDYIRVARRFFSWLVDEGTLTTSPTQTIKPPRHPLKVVQPFSTDDVKRMLAVCDYDAAQPCAESWLGLRNTAIILVLLDTGMRRRELTDLHLFDLSDNMDRLKVLGKNHEERVVAIHPVTQKALLKYLLKRARLLEEWRIDNPYMWIGRRGERLKPNGLSQLVETLCRRAGISGVKCSPHTFRHTAGTMSLRNGASERDVQDMLGHRTPDMTRHYTATIGSEQAAERHKTFSAVGALGKR